MFIDKRMGLILGLMIIFWVGCAGGRRASAPKMPASPSPSVSSGQELSRREQIIKLRAEQIRLEKEGAEEEKSARTKESPEVRQARSELEKAEKRKAKSKKTENETVSRAGINCPNGDSSEVKLLDNRAVEKTYYRTNAIVRIINPYPNTTLDIETPKYGLVVQGLCPRGSVSLSFVLHWEDPDSMTIPLNAKGELPSGGFGVATFNLYLDKRNYYNRVQQSTWNVYLNEIYVPR